MKVDSLQENQTHVFKQKAKEISDKYQFSHFDKIAIASIDENGIVHCKIQDKTSV